MRCFSATKVTAQFLNALLLRRRSKKYARILLPRQPKQTRSNQSLPQKSNEAPHPPGSFLEHFPKGALIVSNDCIITSPRPNGHLDLVTLLAPEEDFAQRGLRSDHLYRTAGDLHDEPSAGRDEKIKRAGALEIELDESAGNHHVFGGKLTDRQKTKHQQLPMDLCDPGILSSLLGGPSRGIDQAFELGGEVVLDFIDNETLRRNGHSVTIAEFREKC
jgi:hypothetical protein